MSEQDQNETKNEGRQPHHNDDSDDKVNKAKSLLAEVANRVKALLTGDWAGDPRTAQALLGYAALLTVGCVISKSLLALGVATAAVVAYSVIKEMWRGDKLVLLDGGVQTLLNEASHYLVGCGIGAAVVILL